MLSRRLALPVVVAVAAAGLLGACTSAPPEPDDARVSPPDQPVVAAAAADPAGRAVEVSRALFTSSPTAVVAAADDATAIETGATVAAREGSPLLLAPADAAADELSAELARLGASRATTVGDVSGVDFGDVEANPAETPASPSPSPSGNADTHDTDPDDTGTDANASPSASASTSADTVAVATADPGNAAAVATARAAGVAVHTLPEGVTDLQAAPSVLDALGASPTRHTLLIGAGFSKRSDLGWSVAAARSDARLPGGGQRLFPDHRFVAIYGAPGAPSLGVLGEQDVAQTIARARGLAAEYQPYSDRPVVPMLEIIATVAAGDAGPDGDYSNELSVESIEPYVDAAAEAGVYVVLDLQPGRADFLGQAKRYESLLSRPNVGLALDAEWRLGPDQVPLRQIGSVSADEVNATSGWLADLVDREGLPPKMFVLHQFRLSMLQDRARIDIGRPELATLIHADGQGSQPDKQATWNALHVDAPAVAWGWKNFYDEDEPMLTPEQTMTGVAPVPDLVTYQ